jgi:hypothetical protein
MRQRFTPERACSTLTRMRANFRLVRFSAAVSSPRRGFFFPLASFLDRWVIPLESSILVQDCLRRIGNSFRIGNLLVVRLAHASMAQEVDAFAWQGHDDDVLVGVRLLLAAVVQGLFFRVFRPLTPTFGAVDDEAWLRFGRGLALGKVTGIPLGTIAEISQSLLENRQQAMNPIVHLRLTQIKEFAQDGLNRIGLEVNQDKQEFIFWPMQESLATTASGTLTGLPLGSLLGGIELLIRPWKGSQQNLKLQERQAREGQKLSAGGLERSVCDHAFIVFLIPDNVY